MHRIPDDPLHLPKYASNNQNAIHIGSTQDASGAMRQKTTKPNMRYHGRARCRRGVNHMGLKNMSVVLLSP